VTQFFQYIVVGLANGGVYATLALALVLIHRATGIVNFAQGEMGMFCTFIAWSLITHHGLPYWGAFFLTLLIAFVGASAACSGGGSGPNVPSHAGRKLTGTWDGTLVISRRNVPDSVGQLRWTFTVDEVAPVNGYRVQVVSNNPWLPFTTTGISVLDAPGGQTSPIYTHGVYTSPRGCSETFSSVGIASDTKIDASFTSADCDSQTFTGSVTLTRSTR